MEENELIINDENIKNLIYMVRGKQVMLDRDLAKLYHCGASLKDLGKKCFGINRIEDVDYIEKLNDKVKVNS